MIKIDKTFIAGKMNKDIDERLVPEGEYLDALNVTIDTTRGSTLALFRILLVMRLLVILTL
jgi:hypothetical protein